MDDITFTDITFTVMILHFTVLCPLLSMSKLHVAKMVVPLETFPNGVDGHIPWQGLLFMFPLNCTELGLLFPLQFYWLY